MGEASRLYPTQFATKNLTFICVCGDLFYFLAIYLHKSWRQLAIDSRSDRESLTLLYTQSVDLSSPRSLAGVGSCQIIEVDRYGENIRSHLLDRTYVRISLDRLELRLAIWRSFEYSMMEIPIAYFLHSILNAKRFYSLGAIKGKILLSVPWLARSRQWAVRSIWRSIFQSNLLYNFHKSKLHSWAIEKNNDRWTWPIVWFRSPSTFCSLWSFGSESVFGDNGAGSSMNF